MKLLCFLFGCITSISLFSCYDLFKENVRLKERIKVYEKGDCDI